jgi:hypothetical protein
LEQRPIRQYYWHMLEEVQKWLNTQGFSLEMRTASAFRKAGFEVQQSALYADEETGKFREIDVLALDPDIIGILNILFVIECKASSKPWVLLCSQDVLAGHSRLRTFSAMSEDAMVYWQTVFGNPILRSSNLAFPGYSKKNLQDTHFDRPSQRAMPPTLHP